MKKITNLAFLFTVLCSINHCFSADDAHAVGQTTERSGCGTARVANAAKQHRYVRTQVFVNLLQKVQNSPEDTSKFIAYTLDWMQELSQSEDAADKELYQQLYALIRSICVEVTSESAAQEDQENSAQ